MFWWKSKSKNTDAISQPSTNTRHNSDNELDAIRTYTAYICFTPDGNILEVNPLFLDVVGYKEAEIIGKHHRMFCPSHYSSSSEYQQFWQNLASGKAYNGTFLWLKKNQTGLSRGELLSRQK